MTGGNVAYTRILLIIVYFISAQAFADSPFSGGGSGGGNASALKNAGAKATDPLAPHAANVKTQANNFGIATSTVSAAAAKLNPPSSTCDAKKVAADYACLEKLSPSIVQFVSEHGAMTQMVLTTASGVAEQCKGISEALNKANLA